MLLLLAACTSGPAMDDTASDDTNGGGDDTGLVDEWRDVSIDSIQQGALERGTPIRVSDVVVTGVAPSGRGLFVQESGEAYGGIWVYMQGGGFVFEAGQVVTVTGLVEEYDAEGDWPDSLTEIDSSALGDVVGSGDTHEGFAPIALDGVTDLEPFEGLLVTVTDLVVEDGQQLFGEWTASGWTFDDKLSEQDTVYPGDTLEQVTGVLDYGYGTYKIQPRTGEDLVGHVSTVVGIDQLSEGQLTVTELMIDPGSECVDADDEYMELYNASGYQVDLDGLVVHYDDGSSTLGYAVVPPYSHVLLVRQSPSPCYGHAGDAELHLPLTQELGEVALRAPAGTLLDRVDTAGWTIEPGIAMGVDGETWCAQTTPLRSDFGTPGAPNDACE